MHYTPPEYVKAKSEQLWIGLMDSQGDDTKITALLDDVMSDDPRTFAQVLGVTLTLFFSQSWPAVLGQLAAHGVSGDDVASGIADDMAARVSDYLRADVVEGA